MLKYNIYRKWTVNVIYDYINTFNPIMTTYLYMRSFHTTHPYFKHVGIILLQVWRNNISLGGEILVFQNYISFGGLILVLEEKNLFQRSDISFEKKISFGGVILSLAE